MVFHFKNYKEMRIFVYFLFLRLSYVQTLSNKNITTNRYVTERAFSHSDVNSSIECAILCSTNPDCCGYTHETTTVNCLLYHYQLQTSNNCQNDTDGSVELQYVKQLTDCSELPQDNPSGIYKMYPLRQDAVMVYCEMTDASGGWTVLQRRQDGSEDFYRYWTDYKIGFGDLENEFWLGNDIIHTITSQKQYKVRFDLQDIDGLTVYAEYENFHVGNEDMNYGLNISGYSGTAGKTYGLDYARFGIVPFSTRDFDNDERPDKSCSIQLRSGWWHVTCTGSNINALFRPGKSGAKSIYWYSWRHYDCLNKTRMMIKPAF